MDNLTQALSLAIDRDIKAFVSTRCKLSNTDYRCRSHSYLLAQLVEEKVGW